MSNPALKIRHINKYFHDPTTFQVLRDISFDVGKGEFISLIGKSGSGKSTLLYILSTMDTDYQGTIELNGEQLTGRSQNALAAFRNEHIGFVFQFHYLLPEFTVLQNVMLPALKLGKLSPSEIESKAYESLTLLDLGDQSQKRASNLSGGQQQRVAIARALINSPAIIMGDEPTGNLDSKNSVAVQSILRELARSFGQTIVCVTHDKDFASRTDRTIELKDGCLIK